MLLVLTSYRFFIIMNLRGIVNAKMKLLFRISQEKKGKDLLSRP